MSTGSSDRVHGSAPARRPPPALLHPVLVNQERHIDGNGYELNAIAAVVIGGTSLAGGVGTVFGSMVGALTLSVLDNILGLRNIESEVQVILKGVIIVRCRGPPTPSPEHEGGHRITPTSNDQSDQINHQHKEGQRRERLPEHVSWPSP